MSWNHKSLFPLAETSLEFALVLQRCCLVLLTKKFSKTLGKILFSLSYTNFKLLMVTISFSLNILNSLCICSLGSHGLLKFTILRALLWIFSIFCKTCVCVCPHNRHPYHRWGSKMA